MYKEYKSSNQNIGDMLGRYPSRVGTDRQPESGSHSGCLVIPLLRTYFTGWNVQKRSSDRLTEAVISFNKPSIADIRQA